MASRMRNASALSGTSSYSVAIGLARLQYPRGGQAFPPARGNGRPGADISTDSNGRDDTRINSITFRKLRIKLE